MQSPTATDPSFQKFIEDIKKQNSVSNVTQMAQLKYEREMAKEDNDKREEQLDQVVDGLKEIRIAVTGVKLDVDITPLVDSLSNQTEILKKSLEEQSLLRKISEGSLEYDKASAQYRNTSGREIVSSISGKDIKKGGYVDFETATDRLSNQGKRVRESEANKLNLKTISSYSPGKQISSQLTTPDKRDTPSKETTPVETLGNLFDLLKELKGRFTDVGRFVANQQPSKEKTANLGANAESDNIQSPAEIVAETAKNDLDVSREVLSVQKEQLLELKKISAVLAPSTPAETPTTTSAVTGRTSEEGSTVDGALPSLPDININKSPKGIPKKAPGKASMGSRILGGLGKAARVLGPVGAAVGAAYSGFQGYQNTAANFDLPEGQEATLGQKAASTLGGVASGLTFGLVDEKIASQKIHQAGEYVGEKAKAAYEGAKDIGGKAVSYVKDMVPVVGEKAKEAFSGAKELGIQAYTGAKEAVSSAGSKVADFFGIGKSKNNTVIEAAKQAATTPATTRSIGVNVARTSTENNDLARVADAAPATTTPMISNSVNNINKTSYVPVNPTARVNTNSALDHYLVRTAVY